MEENEMKRMSGDFEKIDLSLPTSDYALVVFHNLPETYSPDHDLECRYTVTSALTPSDRDWVGIYKVGWRSAREYYCFEYAKIPEGYSQGTKAEVGITFRASSLPKDDADNFYQFCYVTSAGHVRGASTPFQFRVAVPNSSSSEDFVEVEDEEDEDILVIKTKTAILEDNLGKAETEKEELSKTIEYLEKEKDSLLEKLIASDKALALEKDGKSALEQKLTETKETLEAECDENKGLVLLHESLKNKLTVINQEKESMNKRLDDTDIYIGDLQEKIKALVNEKDALTGLNKTLEEEKELLKTSFTTSEDQVKGYLFKLDELRRRLHQEEQTAKELRAEVAALTAELTAEKVKIDERQQATDTDKVTIAELTEKLKNSEDKLLAAEKCKELLKTEVSAIQLTFEKLSHDLETSKSETHTYKGQLSKQAALVQTQTDRINSLQAALHTKEQELTVCQEDCRKLKLQSEEQERSLKVEEQGSLYALQVAYKNLSERYEKVRAAKDEGRNHLQEAVNKLKQLEQEKQALEENCRRRLQLGREEYEKRVVECQRLQDELKRAIRGGSRSREKETLRRQSSSSSNIRQIFDSTETAASSTIPKTIQSEASASSSSSAHPVEAELTEVVVGENNNLSLMEMTTSEMQGQLANLGQELENRQAKKQKYKQLYQEEKEKRAYLQKHYYEELKQKDAEIEHLRQKLSEARDDCQQRITTFEAMIEEQKEEMRRERSGMPNAPITYPPQQPYPMPRFMAPAPAPQPYYPPQQLPPQPLTLPPPMCPPGPIYHHPLPTNVPISPPPPNRPPPIIPPRPTNSPAVVNPVAPTPPNNPSPPQSLNADPELQELDPLNNPRDPDTEETAQSTLPPPITPQKSVDALVAEVKAVNKRDPNDTHIDMGEEEEEERFHDAEEALPPTSSPTPEEIAAAMNGPDSLNALRSLVDLTLRQCPICEMIFPDETLERVLYRHVESHFKNTCPMCSQTFGEGVPQREYHDHVQSHFNDD